MALSCKITTQRLQQMRDSSPMMQRQLQISASWIRMFSLQHSANCSRLSLITHSLNPSMLIATQLTESHATQSLLSVNSISKETRAVTGLTTTLSTHTVSDSLQPLEILEMLMASRPLLSEIFHQLRVLVSSNHAFTSVRTSLITRSLVA
jgi:hypothetical protein